MERWVLSIVRYFLRFRLVKIILQSVLLRKILQSSLLKKILRSPLLRNKLLHTCIQIVGLVMFLSYYATFFINTDVIGVYCKRADWYQGVSLSEECMCITGKTYTSSAYVHISEDLDSDAKCAMTIKPIGRLGNLMGQYATLFSLSRINGRPAVLFPEMNKLRQYFFRLSLPSIHKSVAQHTLWTKYLIHDWMEDSYSDFQGTFVKLVGYPCSWTFFHKIREELLWEFTFSPSIVRDVQDFLYGIRGNMKTATYVGVHVRRGDYVRLMRDLYNGVVADATFFQQAMDYYRQRYRDVLFVLSSDDLDWCRKNVDFSRGDVFIAWNEKEADPGRDMALLSHCNHSIITIGTFGFWSAYLAGGDVVYMSNFTRPNSSFDAVFHPDSFYLPNWKGIPANLSIL